VLPAIISTEGAWARETFCTFWKQKRTFTDWKVLADCTNPASIGRPMCTWRLVATGWYGQANEGHKPIHAVRRTCSWPKLGKLELVLINEPRLRRREAHGYLIRGPHVGGRAWRSGGSDGLRAVTAFTVE